MRDNEFNQNIEIEYSQSKELEVVRAIDAASMREDSLLCTEYSRSEEFYESDIEKDTKEQADKRRVSARKKKILKMAMATVGTVTVLSAVNTTTPDHIDCIFTTQYNDMLDGIIESVENEDYNTFARLMGSDEMEACLSTFYANNLGQMKQDNHLHDGSLFMYDGKNATDCSEACYETHYAPETRNLYIQTSQHDDVENESNGIPYSKGSIYLTISPSLNMTDEYIEEANDIRIAIIGVYYPENNVFGQNTSDDISDFLGKPSFISIAEMSLVDYDLGKDYELLIVLPDAKGTESYKVFSREYCANWKDGPRGPVVDYIYNSDLATLKHEFFVGDDGHVVPGYSKTTKIPKVNVGSSDESQLAEWVLPDDHYEWLYVNGPLLHDFQLLDDKKE